MTVQEIIDQALAQGDNVSPSSADYILRRRLALSFLREVLDDVWWKRDWPWKRRNNVSVVIPAMQGYVNLPNDFNSLGVFGGIYTDLGKPLEEVPEAVIWEFNAISTYSSTDRDFFAIHSQDETTFLPQLHIPRNAQTQELRLFYQADPPHLLDAGDTYATVAVTLTMDSTTGIATATCGSNHGFETGDRIEISGVTAAPPWNPVNPYNGSFAITVTGPTTFIYTATGAPFVPAVGAGAGGTAGYDVTYSDRAILRVPSKYHGCVFMWGVRAMLRESKGDQRWAYANAQFENGLKNILTEEARDQSRRNGLQQLPSFFGNRRGYH